MKPYNVTFSYEIDCEDLQGARRVAESEASKLSVAVGRPVMVETRGPALATHGQRINLRRKVNIPWGAPMTPELASMRAAAKVAAGGSYILGDHVSPERAP